MGIHALALVGSFFVYSRPGECRCFTRAMCALMRISTSLPDGKWREVGEAARSFEDLGFDQAAAHEIQHDSFATLVPATLSTQRIGLTTSVAIAFPRSPMIVAILAQDLNVNSNGRFVLGLGSQVKQHNERRFSTAWTSTGAANG